MKLLKYLIFLSILSSSFIVIYRQFDIKGFRRWWICFKIAVFIAAVLSGLILPSTEAVEKKLLNFYKLLKILYIILVDL